MASRVKFSVAPLGKPTMFLNASSVTTVPISQLRTPHPRKQYRNGWKLPVKYSILYTNFAYKLNAYAYVMLNEQKHNFLPSHVCIYMYACAHRWSLATCDLHQRLESARQAPVLLIHFICVAIKVAVKYNTLIIGHKSDNSNLSTLVQEVKHCIKLPNKVFRRLALRTWEGVWG